MKKKGLDDRKFRFLNDNYTSAEWQKVLKLALIIAAGGIIYLALMGLFFFLYEF